MCHVTTIPVPTINRFDGGGGASARCIGRTLNRRRGPRSTRTTRGPAGKNGCAPLDAERSEIIAEVQAALTDSTRGVVDGTLDLADSLDQKILESNRELREQIHELKIEVARLVAVADELRKGQAPLDLPRLPLRPSREVN
jgi:hypothetical protein